MTAQPDYATAVHISASAERVLKVLTTADEFGSWWGPATGSAAPGGELKITFESAEDPLVLRVRQAVPAVVAWEVHACAFRPEWVGTVIVFTISESDAGGCDLHFRHHGLRPHLPCYELCRFGWDHYVSSLRVYIQTGTGSPFTQARPPRLTGQMQGSPRPADATRAPAAHYVEDPRRLER